MAKGGSMWICCFEIISQSLCKTLKISLKICNLVRSYLNYVFMFFWSKRLTE